MVLKCGCGSFDASTECGQVWLCDRCRKRYYGRLRKRARAAFAGHVRTAHSEWVRAGARAGQEPRPALVTLTVRHSGDAARDRERLVKAWTLLRKWVWKRIGKFPYALLFEVTEGKVRRGEEVLTGPHVHAHALVVWPYFDWSEMAAQWKRAVRDPDARAPYVSRTVKSRSGEALALSARRAADYAAKYATKGVQLGTMAPEMAANVIAGWYGKRRLTVSTHFWLPPPTCCKRCEERWRVVARPAPAPSTPSERLAALRARAASMMPPGFALGDLQGVLPSGA